MTLEKVLSGKALPTMTNERSLACMCAFMSHQMLAPLESLVAVAAWRNDVSRSASSHSASGLVTDSGRTWRRCIPR
jgi:hypothetical protein